MSESDQASDSGQKGSIEIGLEVNSQVVSSSSLKILGCYRILAQIGVENIIPGFPVIDPGRKGKIAQNILRKIEGHKIIRGHKFLIQKSPAGIFVSLIQVGEIRI